MWEVNASWNSNNGGHGITTASISVELLKICKIDRGARRLTVRRMLRAKSAVEDYDGWRVRPLQELYEATYAALGTGLS